MSEEKNQEILEKIVESKGKEKVVWGEQKDSHKKWATSSSKETSFIPPYEFKLHFSAKFEKELMEKYKIFSRNKWARCKWAFRSLMRSFFWFSTTNFERNCQKENKIAWNIERRVLEEDLYSLTIFKMII